MQNKQNMEDVPIASKPKRRWWKVLLVLIIIILVVVLAFWLGGSMLSSRQSRVETSFSPSGSMEAPSKLALDSEGYSQEEVSYDEVQKAEAPDSAAAGDGLAEQKVIKTADLTMTVQSVTEATASITEVANDREGFIQNSRKRESAFGDEYATITIKVPVEKFDEVVSKIKEFAKVVDSENISGQDVTEQFVDLEARLGNARSTEARYVEILNQANTVDEILKVERQLSSTRQEIERLEGQMKYLENQTDMSTITVYLQPESSDIASKPWNPLNEVKNASQSWLNFAKSMVTGLIWIVIYGVPLALIIWLIVVVIKAAIKKRNKQK